MKGIRIRKISFLKLIIGSGRDYQLVIKSLSEWVNRKPNVCIVTKVTPHSLFSSLKRENKATQWRDHIIITVTNPKVKFSNTESGLSRYYKSSDVI